jgi:hypothetical protein
MTQELEQVQAEQVNINMALAFAETIAKSDIVPEAYRGKPANILVASEFGKQYNLSPVQSMYSINVIQGRPSFQAQFILGVMRNNGYDLGFTAAGSYEKKDLAVTITDKKSENSVTKTIKWAAQMGLAGKDNWQKQPETMLKWRAVSEFARFYAPELFIGGVYTPDELLESIRENEPIRVSLIDAEHVAVEPVTVDAPQKNAIGAQVEVSKTQVEAKKTIAITVDDVKEEK